MLNVVYIFACVCVYSAGAGRTGTFCALSTVLERVKAEGILDVFQTVKSLRLQRPHMVQTLVRTFDSELLNITLLLCLKTDFSKGCSGKVRHLLPCGLLLRICDSGGDLFLKLHLLVFFSLRKQQLVKIELRNQQLDLLPLPRIYFHCW